MCKNPVGGFHNWAQNGWFRMDNPVQLDADQGYPYFRKPPVGKMEYPHLWDYKPLTISGACTSMNGIVTTQVYWLVKNNDKITWWFIPRIVSGLIHPSYKWTTCPHLSHENNQGYNPQKRSVGSSPPSNDRHQLVG